MSKILAGDRFGEWEVIDPTPVREKNRASKILVRCSCGRTEKLVTRSDLGINSSRCSKCVNVKYDSEIKRRLSYRAQKMKARCNYEGNKDYANYGARGIAFLFDSIEDCVEYIVALPDFDPSKQIDRIDNEKGYMRGNLQWVTAKENQLNRRDTGGVQIEIGRASCRERV
jgi:hypothetical protein